MSTLTLQTINKAYERISPAIHRTAVLTSEGLDRMTGKNLYLKAENFQKTGSFKGRGALNGITNSSGNFGMALAWAAGQSSLKCTVVVPDNAPEYKVANIKAYGADVVRCEANLQARHETCERLATELGYEAIDPHNHFDVMAGQGTIAKELLEQVPNLDAIIVSLGGGGLSSGIAKYVMEAHPNVKGISSKFIRSLQLLLVFLCEPMGKQFEKQMTSGVRVVTPDLLQTMADGIRIREVGDNCFPVLCECAQRTVLTISEDEIKSAMRLIWERLKVVVEASAALPLAAVLKYKEELRDFHSIGLILCGGNLNIDGVFA
ncbi:aspartate racemase [Aphelenchoides avenae]|nr:aspartate racemase [Aphelenchus avenae]